MARRVIKQTANLIAKEIALLVFVVLAIVAYVDYLKKLDAIRNTPTFDNSQEVVKRCYEDASGGSYCDYHKAASSYHY